ncbi:MAG TPA: diaminopimelate epimerase [Rhizomicrobium sp.]|nr:diaminopimelate epimerase [Rhizomicrobium sp.]
MIPFQKMHGLGNDFVIFDARRSPLALDNAAARAVADRRTGIGCDQVIVLERAKTKGDALMRIFNADGNEVEACGNAARCVARLLMEERDSSLVEIDSAGGLLRCTDGGDGHVTVDMGIPRLGWQEIPLSEARDTNALGLQIEGVELDTAAVSVGNPHCVVFVSDADAAPVSGMGARLERHALFPEHANVEFVSVAGPAKLRMRVWERGVGETRACGTGACASLVASARRRLVPRSCEVILDGGTLSIEWRTDDDHVLMTGGTNFVFAGEIDVAALEARG